MFSFLEGWAYSLAGLCSISKKDRNGIKSNLKKLKKISRYGKSTLGYSRCGSTYTNK